MPTAPEPVIAALQTSVSLHLTAIEHYATLAEHLSRVGYTKLGERYRRDADEERGHLADVVRRLEFFNTQPTYTHAAPSWPRYDFPGILAANLELETRAAETERAGIVTSRAAGDEGTAVTLTVLLDGSEESLREIEADRFVISQVGLDNFLANQV